MRPLILIVCSLGSSILLSCSKKEKETESEDKQDYFSNVEASSSPDSLKNEMAAGETDFLRSFADHRIAWQKWDKSILEKSQKAQVPIFAFVGSASGGSSIRVAREFEAKETLRRKLSRQAISTVIDINAFPEIATLGFHLNSELGRTMSFPMLIWLSHEGSPIGWIPIGDESGSQLKMIVDSATSMVEDIWEDSSRYAVENSRRDNEARQKRFDLAIVGEPSDPRDEIFRRETRKLASLHSFEEQDLADIGGLIPYSSLELLAIGSCSRLLTDEVRERCRKAAQSVTRGLLNGAIKDQLDGAFFHARRTDDWSLPAFSKDIITQTKVAGMLYKLGSILDDAQIEDEASSLLELIESEWLAKSISSRAPVGDSDVAGKFLWDFKTLGDVLTGKEFALAKTAFSLKSSGNIPIEVDPLGNYIDLNSLTARVPLSKIAEEHHLTETEASTILTQLKKKLLAHRKENTLFFSENTLTVFDLSCVLTAQVARAARSADGAHLKAAEATADRILETYWTPGKGLARLKSDEQIIPARGADYMQTALALTQLYQCTLDERWLTAALEIMEHALSVLAQETDLLAEVPPEERIIPLRQHNVFMIFGDSTLGLADSAANRFYALTGRERFTTLLDGHVNLATGIISKSVVNHTDFIASCALGDKPLVAVLQGDPKSEKGRMLLTLLNSPKRLPFLTIRPETGSERLSPLPGIPAKIGEASVVLIRDQQSLGQAASPEKLTELLDSVISGK